MLTLLYLGGAFSCALTTLCWVYYEYTHKKKPDVSGIFAIGLAVAVFWPGALLTMITVMVPYVVVKWLSQWPYRLIRKQRIKRFPDESIPGVDAREIHYTLLRLQGVKITQKSQRQFDCVADKDYDQVKLRIKYARQQLKELHR